MGYTVDTEKGEDFGFVAHCPAIPECHSQGETMEEAIENICGCIEALGEDLMPLPKDSLLVEVSKKGD